MSHHHSMPTPPPSSPREPTESTLTCQTPDKPVECKLENHEDIQESVTDSADLDDRSQQLGE